MAILRCQSSLMAVLSCVICNSSQGAVPAAVDCQSSAMPHHAPFLLTITDSFPNLTASQAFVRGVGLKIFMKVKPFHQTNEESISLFHNCADGSLLKISFIPAPSQFVVRARGFIKLPYFLAFFLPSYNLYPVCCRLVVLKERLREAGLSHTAWSLTVKGEWNISLPCSWNSGFGQ